jgi:hypothetical protein
MYADANFVYAVNDTEGLQSFSVDANGVLTPIDSIDNGGNYYGIWGANGYIITACGDSGIRAYQVNGSGFLTLRGSSHPGAGLFYDVWFDGNFIYACSIVYPNTKLWSFSIDGSGNLTAIDSDTQAVSGNGEYRKVHGDGTYIYVGCETDGVRTYSVDGSGFLTYESVAPTTAGKPIRGLWAQGGYVYGGAYNEGIRIYSIGGGGVLTYLSTFVDPEWPGHIYWWITGDTQFIYAWTGSHLKSFEVSGANLILKDRYHGDDMERGFTDISQAFLFAAQLKFSSQGGQYVFTVIRS